MGITSWNTTAHDAQGYCTAVRRGAGDLWRGRHNVCVNNGRSPKLARRQGDIYISTWEKGALDGVEIHDNTIYWNPPIDAPAFQIDHADFTGARPNVFRDNIVYSTVPSMIHAGPPMKLERNTYWYTGRAEAKWTYAGVTQLGFKNYQARTGQDASGSYADPKLAALLGTESNSQKAVPPETAVIFGQQAPRQMGAGKFSRSAQSRVAQPGGVFQTAYHQYADGSTLW
jgi:hypothetical protein